MTIRLQILLITVTSVGSLSLISAQQTEPQPVNRIGARFDQTANPRAAQLEQFQKSIAQNVYPANTAPPAHVRNVAYEPPQQDNSFGSQLNPLPQTSEANTTPGRTSVEGTIELTECSVAFIDNIELPALENGQIKKLNVKE